MASEPDIDFRRCASHITKIERCSALTAFVSAQNFSQSWETVEGKLIAPFNPQTFVNQVGHGKTALTSTEKQILFSQGDAANAVFYMQAGNVKLSMVSQQGKEAADAMMEPS